MSSRRSIAFAGSLALSPLGSVESQPGYRYQDVRSYPFPSQLVAAAKVNRVAWVQNQEGRRNVWIADGPSFRARQLTSFDRDDGQELTSLTISGDGRWVVFVRGGDHDCNWDCTVPINPSSSPQAPVVSVWIVPADRGAGRAIGDGDTPAISPAGDRVAFVRDRQIWIAPLDGTAAARRLFAARGELREPTWSPDGRRLAFSADRGDHGFIGIYTDDTTSIRWLAPSTGRDAMPRWSPDGKRIAFVRRPGVGGPPDSVLAWPTQPWRIVVADAATGQGQPIWISPPTPEGGMARIPGGPSLLYTAANRIVFRAYLDGWPHLYAIADTGGRAGLITPGPYQVDGFSLSPDHRYVVASANAGSTPDDIDRRHLIRVAIDRADVTVLTPGTGLEYSPVVTSDGAAIAFFGATAARPALPMLMPVGGGAPRPMAGVGLPNEFPEAAMITPRAVTFRAADGLTIRGQLFAAPGGPARRPAVIFAHGGPERQMLLGWHSGEYYAATYALNQYLASRGYVVLSVNYRLGVGYGFGFHRVVDGWSRGASEYQDIVAAAHYLRARGDVDPNRIGIYGGSYGGFLTAMALAKHSDLFAAGVNIHGPSDWTADDGRRIGGLGWDYERGDRAAAADVAWKASPVAWVDGWRSPVLFIHGDDDRNTRFYHTIDLVRRLEARGVPFEELVIPDDNHHWFRFVNAVRVGDATAAFLDRYLRR